jgi:hypothetical protein
VPLRGAKRCIAMAFAVLVTAVLPVLGGAAAAQASVPTRTAGQVVLIGVPGLRWSDLDERGTPALWSLTARSSAAALSVRATGGHTCATDGWLSVSAGQRARLPNSTCALPPAPAVSGSVAAVPAWSTIKADNAATSYRARIGLLGDAVQRGQGCTLAVGPGAVFGAADGNGLVDVYAETPAKVPADAWGGCALTVVEVDHIYRAHVTAGVDAGGAPLPVSQDKQAAAVQAADQRVAEVLRAVPATATLVVLGLADLGNTPHLHVAMAHGRGFGPGYLTSNATRQPRLVTLTDTTATILRTLGLPQPAEAVGSPWRTERTGKTAAAKVAELDDEDVAAQAVRQVQPAFFIVLFGGQLLLYGLATVALRRRWGGERRILAATRLIALIGAAAPVASFLANLVPWWQATHPAGALIAGVVCWIGVVTALALAGPWRRSLVGPGLVIAGITALVLGLDVMIGSRLNLNALMGYTALVAGRFYGFGNQAFALFAVAALLSAAWLAERSVRAGHTRTAVAIVAATGAAAVVIDGWPDWGSDFGGVLALVPAIAVLALLVAGRPVSVRFVLACCLAGVVLVLVISALDAQRAEPSHLGRFWDDLMNGDAWGVIARKAGAMLRSLGYWPFTVAAVGALGFLFLVLARPLQWRAALLDRAYHYSPTLRPALTAALVLAITGMLVNDSGVVVPAIVFSLAIPLALAASVRALELDGAAATPPA